MNYSNYLVETMHTCILASTDSNNHPVTCAIDLMHEDQQGIYFLTAKGKGLYKRLISNPVIALSALHGQSTMTRKCISLQGKIKQVDDDYLEILFSKNPYMLSMYPTMQSRKALCVFCIYEATGEWFDLSTKPITRESFTVGNIELEKHGYFVDQSKCIGCTRCISSCPTGAIRFVDGKANIDLKHCLHCGNCKDACMHQAIIQR